MNIGRIYQGIDQHMENISGYRSTYGEYIRVQISIGRIYQGIDQHMEKISGYRSTYGEDIRV